MKFDTNLFLKLTRKIVNLPGGFKYQTVRPRVICEDGFSVSIQAGENLYSIPREDEVERYTAVELGYPSQEDELINEYAEDGENYTNTVYAWVPVEVVDKLIEKHGGIVDIKVRSE